ncbi:hypothetical protein [Streptomyces sp. ODS28]|uniref:D-alanine--D-alanine ligase family protein n=1 Tax=Streptomyces sp. ODS28 TaxID=3136688 RepID=UPI0031E8640F
MAHENGAAAEDEFAADAVMAALGRLGYAGQRFGDVRELAAALAAGHRWDTVLNLTEGPYGREAEVPSLLGLYGIPCVGPDPLTATLIQHKALAKHMLRAAGLPTAPFHVVDDVAALESHDFSYPVFAKPVGEYSSRGIDARCRAHDPAQLRRAVAGLLSTFRQPVLVENYLPGREFSVGILGTGTAARVLGVLDIRLGEQAEGLYSYSVKRAGTAEAGYLGWHLADDREAQQAAESALSAWKLLGCRDVGRIDLRGDAHGRPHLLEINSPPGLCPDWSDLVLLTAHLGWSYDELIDAILTSALSGQTERES